MTTAHAPWSTEGSEKRAAVKDMFAEIAPNYDFCNSVMTLWSHRRWRAFAASLLKLNQDEAVLDLCSGTGDFMPPLRKLVGSGGLVVGVDFCLPMLERAREKDGGGLLLGDAGSLPFRSEAFSGVAVGWGIRNVPDADHAHREIFRVLSQGGRFVSIDTALPRNAFVRVVSGWICGTALPLLGALVRKKTAYTYLPKSTQKFKSREELKASMESAGFEDVYYRDLFAGNICIHCGRKP